MKQVFLCFVYFLAIACSSPKEKQAYRQFRGYISVIDSTYTALGNYWEYSKMSEMELMEKTKDLIPLISTVDESAKKAAGIIAPYDTLLSRKVGCCHGFAEDAVFYAEMYLKGEGKAYFDKFETWLGHVWTAIQDVKEDKNFSKHRY